MRKYSHGRILKEEPKEQHVSTVLKSCSFNNIWGHMIRYTIQQKFNEFFKIIYHVIKMVLNEKVKTTEPRYLFNKISNMGPVTSFTSKSKKAGSND